MKFSTKISSGLVAVAVAASCGYVSAATVTAAGGVDRISKQGAASAATAGATSMTMLGAVVKLAGSYNQNDELTISLSGQGQFGALNTGNMSKVACVQTAGSGIVTFQFLSRGDANTITYFAESTPGTSSVASECTFNSLGILNSSLTTTGSNTSIAISGKKSGTGSPFDNETTSAATLGSVVDQYTVSRVSAFDGEIDVSTGRLTFTNGTGDTATSEVAGSRDSLAFRVVNESGITTAATAGSLSVSITAPSGWSFLDTDGNGVIDTAATRTGAITATTAAPLAGDVTLSSATVLRYSSNTLADAVHTITVGRRTTDNTGTAFEAQTFSSTGVSIAAGSSAAAVAASLTPGTWTLNGTTVQVPYMPYGTSIDQNIRISNRSTQTAGVTVQARNALGTLCGAATLAGVTVGANQVKDITADVKTYVNNCFSTASDAPNHRVSLSITTNLPSAQTEVYTGFTVNSTTTGPSRVSVTNSSNGK